MGDMTMNNHKELYDFSAIGQAIKEARESRGWTREKVAEMVDLAPLYIMSIENTGQHPSFQKFYELATLFYLSVDEYFYPNTGAEKTTRRRQLENNLDELDDMDLIIMSATAKGIKEAKETGE